MAEYINREKTKRELSEWCISLNSPHLLSRDDTMFLLDNIPAADVAPVVHGRWQGTADGYADGELVYDMWECSVCGFDADGAEEKPCWDFCPNCGARMDGDSDAKAD